MHAAVADITTHIGPIIADASNHNFRLRIARNRPVQHSVPKRKHLRRVLTIPNPLPYAILCKVVADNWTDIQAAAGSTISLSTPVRSDERAVEALFDRSEEVLIRARRSVGSRFLVKTDLLRYYPSVYTHSIPWAVHGKVAARADTQNTLYGNRLDVCVRESQDKQTGGIPIGPDTSFIIGELIGSRLDRLLEERLAPTPLKGTRFIDDYHLYFSSRGDAERAIAAIHGVAREFELEINDVKTELCEVPEIFEPEWKTHLRSIQVGSSENARSMHSLFDYAAEFVQKFPSDSIYTYLAKKMLDGEVSIETWAESEPLLLRAVLAEPSMLPVLVRLFEIHGVVDLDGLRDTIETLCVYHAQLGQGYEVAWALWLARNTGTTLGDRVGEAVVSVDDDLVALVALDMQDQGLLNLPNTDLWNSYMTQAHLTSEHWLLCYEASERSWLTGQTGIDLIGSNEFFSILRAHTVRFYDTQAHGAVFAGY